MEPPATAAPYAPGYPDSVDSSPRSRGGDSWDEPFPSSAAAASSRLRVMCSYGGRIVPRPTDKSLCYLGGETRMVVIDRHASLADLSAKLSRDLLGGAPFSIKYQLPNEDLDSLISVATDEDLENMIEELDRISSSPATSGSGGGSTRSARLRLFLFPSNSESAPSSSMGSLVDESKSETWFVDALNSAMGGMGVDNIPRGVSTDSASVNCLLGLEDDSVHSRVGGQPETEQLVLPRPDSSGKLGRHGQDVQSVPGSPMLDKASSFGSTSSAPSLSNLPPIPVPTIDRTTDHRITGVDDHFTRMNLTSDSAATQRPDGGFKEANYAPNHQPPPSIPLPTASASSPTISPTENSNRDFPDDDRSDHGGTRKPPQPPKPTQNDVLTADPASRMTFLNPNPDSNIYSDPSYRVPLPVTENPGYVLPSVQPEQLQTQQSHAHLHQQQPQLVQANPHYIHHPATGAVLSSTSYYPMPAHSMQQSAQAHSFDPHIPVFYMPVRHTTPYTFQPNLADPSSIPSSAGKPAVPVSGLPTKPDLPASMYRTAAAAPPPASLQPQLIHVAANQAHPYAGTGYHVMQHPHLSQSPATMANYGYEAATAPGHHQMYYSQASSQPALAAQYQMMTTTAVIPQSSAPGDLHTSRAP
ncbi:hypothetical protein Cni_G11546 [Canna indica]|uniref:PB1 domain-containing protein n=1 Tax=Canna indica TaxID=4628 RepID=A0AAQ3K6B2_9LILI|nr:hypothetical protein Cni_G11546 [Canna indica]